MNLAQEVRQFCKDHGITLKRGLGQHFLVNEGALRTIVDTAAILPNDRVVEIGAGIGILTRELLKYAGHVTAIELDRNLIPLLQTFVARNELMVIHGDALTIEFPKEPYKIVANIPYQITSPLLKHVFLESEALPTSLTLLIQKEVAEKICEREKRGRLSILVQLFGEPRIVRFVPSACFLPPPNVTSAILHIHCLPKLIANQKTIGHVFQLTHLAFGQKRKMLRATIGKIPRGMEILQRAHIEPTRRPETLSIEEWIVLGQHM